MLFHGDLKPKVLTWKLMAASSFHCSQILLKTDAAMVFITGREIDGECCSISVICLRDMTDNHRNRRGSSQIKPCKFNNGLFTGIGKNSTSQNQSKFCREVDR